MFCRCNLNARVRKKNDEWKLNEFSSWDLAVASIEVVGNNVFGIFYSFFLFADDDVGREATQLHINVPWSIEMLADR